MDSEYLRRYRKMEPSVFNLVCLAVLIGYVQAFGCPPEDLIAPCTCIADDITCHEVDIDSEELANIFQRTSQGSPELEFYTLSIWRNNALTELKANTFQDLTFNTLEILDCPNLVDVHPDAFKGTDATTTLVRFSSTGIGRSKNQTIFDVLNKFINAEEIHVYDNGHSNTTIPTGAFTNLTKLKELNVEQELFSRIESGAFNVDNMYLLNLFWTNISYIEDNAFYSKKTVDNDFVLNLIDNRLLSGDSFAEEAFSNIAKPADLYLGHFTNSDDDYWKTPITYLPEKTFLPFLSKSKENVLVLSQVDGYHLDCNDCRNAWLSKNPEVSPQISDGFFDLECENGVLVTDPLNYSNCTV